MSDPSLAPLIERFLGDEYDELDEFDRRVYPPWVRVGLEQLTSIVIPMVVGAQAQHVSEQGLMPTHDIEFSNVPLSECVAAAIIALADDPPTLKAHVALALNAAREAERERQIDAARRREEWEAARLAHSRKWWVRLAAWWRGLWRRKSKTWQERVDDDEESECDWP